MAKIVVALGGNALGNNPVEQQEMVAKAAIPLVALIKEGHEVIISHGNGPQVGMILQSFELARSVDPNIPAVDLAECTAMSQGYIGFHLEKALQDELRIQQVDRRVTSVLTQVEVASDDPGFQIPTKPIGLFYTQAEADELVKLYPQRKFIEDSGRGWRRVVASPQPIDIIEKQSIVELLEKQTVIIACGGGGIPVTKVEGVYKGVSAVIDKDFASSKLAELVAADYLFIFTAVDKVAINFGKSNQEELTTMSVTEAKRYIKEGHFAAGSMLPKVEAALQFVSNNHSGVAIISSLDKAVEAVKGINGTRIQFD